METGESRVGILTEKDRMIAAKLIIDDSEEMVEEYSLNNTSQPPSSPSSPTLSNTLPRQSYLTRYQRMLIAFFISFACVSICIMLDSFQNHQKDTSGCQESYMRPEYIKQEGFDSEMTRFAGKYSLYLYREKGVDISDQPIGVPVLFIHGHAGSYKQVRSIAAESTFYYYRHYARDPVKVANGASNLDFFTVDFHEEFSALHGQSIIEQAEYLNDAIDYILKLYTYNRKFNDLEHKWPDPSSVILVGHSMGGIVARAMFIMNNYQHGTINTIITMSTPHLLPPVPFDWKISQLYDDINNYWQKAYSKQALETDDGKHHSQSFRDIAIISIAGGTLDNTVCSDSTNMGSIVPESHGFTVFSTAVPGVWTATDHVSILTCNQLVKVTSKTLLDIVDVQRGTQTKPLEARMDIMRHAFLDGLDDRKGDGSDLHLGDFNSFHFLESEVIFLRPGERLVIEDPIAKMVLMPTVANADAFSLLTDTKNEMNGRFGLYLCSIIDNTIPNSTKIGCRSANSISVPIPASTEHDYTPYSGRTFSFSSIKFDEMGSATYLGIMDRGVGGFLMAEPFSVEENTHVVEQSMLSIVLEGVHLKIPPHLSTAIRIPSIENPILAYHLRVSRPNCRLYNTHFTPFLRQSISTMHESKFYVNLAGNEEETEISIHGRTAFTSAVRSTHNTRKGLSFQIWMDPVCPESLQMTLSTDWYGSAGRLGFRNGIMLATFSFIVVMLVLVSQIKCYNDTGVFPSFGHGLIHCIKRSLPIVILCIGVCSIAQCTSSSPTYSFDDLWYLPSARFSWQEIMTGNTDLFFWWIPITGLVLSVGVISLLWIVVDGVFRLITHGLVFMSNQCFICTWPITRQESRHQQIQRRVITTFILFVLVATFIPYQFVFVVAFFVQIATCIRTLMILWISNDKSDLKNSNRYNYMLSILLLCFTLLPFNLPILLVWIRNISVHWFVPFSSDHSILAIAPITIYIEILTSNTKMLPRQRGRFWSRMTYVLMYYIIIYAFLYGIKYTHWLYFLSNHFVGWLLLLHFQDSHYGRMTYRYLMEHVHLVNKKHS